MNPVLLTVSGRIPADIEAQAGAGQRPTPDYLHLAHRLPADLLDYTAVERAGPFTRLLAKAAGMNAALAWLTFTRRGDYPLLFTDGEQVGIPLALLLKLFGRGRRASRHVMIAHILSVGKKMLFFDRLGVHTHIDRILAYSTWQRDFIRRRWGLPAGRVTWIPFQADADFFRPDHPGLADLPAADGALICSAGLEFRDYPTLLHAVDGLPVQVVLAAASPWSKRADSSERQAIPSNVSVQRFNLFDLRRLYARARFVVVPLYPVDFQAGVTTILEAMAMGRAVIVTCTPGQTDVIEDGVTGLYVPASDPAALRTAIQRLLDDPALAESLGRAARRSLEASFSLVHYGELLTAILHETQQGTYE